MTNFLGHSLRSPYWGGATVHAGWRISLVYFVQLFNVVRLALSTGEQDDHEHKKRRFLVQNSIKRDCKAVIHIKETVHFPDFKVCTVCLICLRRSCTAIIYFA